MTDTHAALHVTLCEYATIHADGTFSVVRGGWGSWRGALPFELPIWLLVQVPGNTLAAGQNAVEVTVIQAGDGLVIAKRAGSVSIEHLDRPSHFTFALIVPVSKPGGCRVAVSVGAGQGIAPLDINGLESPEPQLAPGRSQ